MTRTYQRITTLFFLFYYRNLSSFEFTFKLAHSVWKRSWREIYFMLRFTAWILWAEDRVVYSFIEMLEKHKFYHFSRVHFFGFSFWCSYRGVWSLSSYFDHSVPIPDTFHDAFWNNIAFSVDLLESTNFRKHQSFSASDTGVTRAKGGRSH